MNPLLTATVDNVYTITKRPDLVDRTLQAVKQATLKLHTKDFYTRDEFETGILFSATNYLQKLEYKTVVPLFRAPNYIRKSDINMGLGPFIDFIDPRNSLDKYNTQRSDVAYLAGSYINIRCSDQRQYFILGCYVYPDVTDADYNSWVASELPYLVAVEAARSIMLSTGNTTLANTLGLELNGPPNQPELGLYNQLSTFITTDVPN